MFEGAVAGILNRLLGKYVQDLDTENLNVGIFSGNVNLTDLKLKPEALYELDLPIDVKIGTIGRISLQIPWTGLYTQPVIVNIDDVLLLVGPAISNSYFDPERERRLTRAAKRKILQDLEAESEILKGPQNFFENLFTAIVNNIQIYVRNVHVRYEDSISSKDGPLACGLCLQSMSIETTNSKWKPAVTPPNASTVYQLMRIESLSAYWNPTATALDDSETAHITPMQYYNWKHYMLTGLDKFSMHREDFEFLLKPVTCKVKVLINRSGEARVPRLLLDAVIHDSALQLSRRQYLSIDNLLASFARIKLNRKYRHLHPGVPLSKDIKKWWHYAYNVVLEQRVKPYTWASIKKHRENYDIYKKTYKSTLRSPNDTELKLDLQKCEDSLPIISVVIAREQAKFELLNLEPERIEVVESEREWWKPSTSPCDSEERTRVELCVKTERSKTLWSHLSSPEKKRVCELIGYVDGAPRQDKSKQCIEHKINLTLANCSLTLINRSKEILVVTVTQFLASLETRPSAKAYKMSCRAENLVVEGVSEAGELVSVASSARGGALPGSNLLALDLDIRPANIDADYALCVLLEPVELVYVEHAFTELINFVQTGSLRCEALRAAGLRAEAHARAVMRRAADREKVFHLNVDCKGPCLLLPEYGTIQKSGKLMVIDISRIIIKSDLQPSNLALEDATCMELEEKLYDRLHAECSAQLLFCDWSDQWRESRRHGDSEHHLVPRVKMQVVFSNSIKKEYKLLPRYKLNISLSSFKLNLSDRIISNLMDFSDNLPTPVPNTVPVSYMDSGDYADDVEDPEVKAVLSLDRVKADPGYAELVKLRQKIVAAYLSRNKCSPSVLEAESESCGGGRSASMEGSDEECEVFARSVDLPGFEDNVSPSNTIHTLLRFIVGEIVINLAKTVECGDVPYVMLRVSRVVVEMGALAYGPALQLVVGGALLADKLHTSANGQYLELLATTHDLLNVIYRKVRADCPEFRSSFHSVEQALVVDAAPLALTLHAHALQRLQHHLQQLYNRIQSRSNVNLKKLIVPKVRRAWDRLMRPDLDPPVPSGATKFSYSVRLSSISIKLCQAEWSMVEVRLGALESDCVFRANDRIIFKLFLASLHVDDLSEPTLYPKLIWPDEDKVLEVKYVRAAPRVVGAAARDPARAHGELRLHAGRLHVVLFATLLHHIQQACEVWNGGAACRWVARRAGRWVRTHQQPQARLNLVIQINAPVLLLPQKPSSPNLLVFNMGDLTIENFFKQVNPSQEGSSPVQGPIIDNILVKLINVTVSRAVMTLAGTLEVQEPILEPVRVRCDVKRCVCYPSAGEVCACAADVSADPILLNVGQKDLATVLAVWNDNLSEGHYIGSIVPSSPVEAPASDTSVKKLQAFLAQGDPIKKETTIKFTLEGLELKLFTDMDEVLSSPVRDLNHGLARVAAGELVFHYDAYNDGSVEVKTSLQSLLVEDIRPDPAITIKRIVECRCGGGSSGGIRVRRAALVEGAARSTPRHTHLDLRVDTTRLNLALPFLLQLARTLLDAMPGEKTLEGGVVNHGYVCEGGARPAGARTSRLHSASDSTSGYYSTGTSVSEEAPGLSISVQFHQPEVMFFTETKGDGHALLLRTELLIDYSQHAGNETFVVALAGLQIMSKLQSKLKNLPPQLVLKPCDVEFSRSFKNNDEGVRAKVSVSEIELHIAATTIHTCLDIMEEITSELTIPDEKEAFNFATYNPRPERYDEDLWSPKKIAPLVAPNPEDGYIQPKFPGKPNEYFDMVLPIVRIIFEIEHTVRVPVIMVKMRSEVSLQDWSAGVHGGAALWLQASAYNRLLDVWEPLIEPQVHNENVFTPWEITATVFQGKAYPMVSRLDSTQPDNENISIASEQPKKLKKKKTGFESETSADECDTDNEMTFIRNPNGRENRNFSMDYGGGAMSFLGNLDVEDSDSDNENRLMNKLTNAIGHLFTDESSGEELSNDDSSAPQSEGEADDETDKAVTFADNDTNKRDEHKTVTLQEPERCSSVDSGAAPPGGSHAQCTYVCVRAAHALQVSGGAGALHALRALHAALTDRAATVTNIVVGDNALHLTNDIGPGSTVYLRTKAETDLAGNDRVVAVADYDVDTSRPSTPGCDTSSGDMLDESETKPKEMTDITDDWDCFEGGFPACEGETGWAAEGAAWSPRAPPSPPALRTRLTDLTLTLSLHDLNQLTIICPQRAVSKLHVLHPSKNGTRYYIVVERSSDYNDTRIVVRSPYQIRNETSYALELLYNKKDLLAVGGDLIGSLTNPFDDKLRLAVIAPHQTYNVPLYIAYHCKLYLMPSNFESHQTASQGIWWMELSNDLGTPRDIICPAKLDDDKSVFAMRIVASEGVQSYKVSRAIPNYLVRVVPPLAIYNRLPYAIEVRCEARGGRWRLEAGERACVHGVLPRDVLLVARTHPPMHAHFTYTHELKEKVVTLSGESEGGAPAQLCATVLRGECCQLHLHAHYWLINKTGLPIQVKSRHSEAVYCVCSEAVSWCGAGGLRVRAHGSRWSRAVRPAPSAPGLVVCAHPERHMHYRILLTVTLSELCPQLTKIVTFLPYFLVYNDTKRHLRYMEENEAADLWMDLSPQQCSAFWPQTDSMAMHCKYRDSTVVSHRFPIAVNHFTVLRMDKGSAICVEVTGGTDKPFTITFKPYTVGDAPVRIDNLCDDLFLKLHQADSGQVALLSPYHSIQYTWDDPGKERKLIWNIYNNKGKGFVADFAQDGFGEEKVSFHSVKHSTLVATSSVTSKLSSTLKRLTPKSPEPSTSSSDDSDSCDVQETHTKAKKMRKDKVIVYWVSYMDGYQRVFALAQDERVAQQYRTRINSERSNYEVYVSLAGIGVSVCIQNNNSIKELAYISVTDTLPKWEVNVNHKWKQLTPDLTSWIEEKYQSEQKKCQLKEYIHIDLEKMQMTKPFFSELRRTYNPGVWMQLRKSDSFTYLHLKLQRLQLDNQLHDAVFPCVLYPAPPPSDVRSSEQKACLEIVTLKQYRPALSQEVYKYFKILVQEYVINLDRGFVNYVFDILNHWKIEEKPAVRLRADLALVHMPLPIIAIKSQNSGQKNVVFEHVHLSPVKLVLSLSSRGCLTDSPGSPYRSRFGNKKENRPKIFNSDLLEYLFNSWGTSLCDMKDIVFRMSYMELRNAPLTMSNLLDAASRHYWTQLIQQFYVLVLGQNILGNPYSYIGDFNKAMKQFYEPYLGTAVGKKCLEMCRRVGDSAGSLLGLSSQEPLLLDPLPPTTLKKTVEETIGNDLPQCVLYADTSSVACLALALTALAARPTFELCRGGGVGGVGAARGGVERALRLSASQHAVRRRMPRHCHHTLGVSTYSVHSALGGALWASCGRGPPAPGHYLAHAFLPPTYTCALMLSTEHMYMVRGGGGGGAGAWHVDWAVKLDDLIEPPRAHAHKLILNIKQDELVNYYSTDEKIIDVPDAELLKWLQAKIECAIILALEDKRCSTQE